MRLALGNAKIPRQHDSGASRKIGHSRVSVLYQAHMVARMLTWKAEGQGLERRKLATSGLL